MGIQIQKFDTQVLITASDDGLAEITASLIVKAFKRLLTYKEHINFIPSSGNTPKKTYLLRNISKKLRLQGRLILHCTE